jgi:hypothetical protein
VLLLLCMQVVIACTWKLLSLVEEDRIFSQVAFAWVNAIVAAVAAAWALLFGVSACFAPSFDDPGVPILLFLTLIGIAVLGLLMVVMRALLQQATALRIDLEAVI